MLLSNSPWTRREFLRNLSIAGGAGLLGLRPDIAAAESPLETTAIRLPMTSNICFAPLLVIDTFLRMEGFDNIQFVTTAGGLNTVESTGHGDIDIGISFAGSAVYYLDAGLPITALGGLHIGCYELFAREPIRTISDLKNRRVCIQTLSSSAHLYVSIMAKNVGLNPADDIEWVVPPSGNAMEHFVAGETEAFLGFPPEPQDLRSQGIDRVILNTVTDQPWSYYFCCMIYGNREWVRNHPVAAKRFLRAIYKAAAFCEAEPEKAARQAVNNGFAERYDYTLQTIKEIPYNLWHELDSEDTMRFYALRLHEAGLIKHTPQQIIDQGTDWQFLNELKQELKA